LLPAKESITPRVAEKFGEVFDVTIEFVEKPNDYYAQNMVEAEWYAKVKAVNGTVLKEPLIIEYRCPGGKFAKGSTVTVRAFEDLESDGLNREWDGVARQFSYGIIRFLRIRNPKDTEQGGDGDAEEAP
jgi:hypothetical protein